MSSTRPLSGHRKRAASMAGILNGDWSGLHFLPRNPGNHNSAGVLRPGLGG